MRITVYLENRGEFHMDSSTYLAYKNNTTYLNNFSRHGYTYGIPRLLTMDSTLYANRLKSFLQGMKNANIAIDAVEIGNEWDWIEFNGDIPVDREATDQEIQAMANKYADVLKKSYVAVKEVYPTAKVTTFGFADAATYLANTPDSPYIGAIPRQCLYRNSEILTK